MATYDYFLITESTSAAEIDMRAKTAEHIETNFAASPSAEVLQVLEERLLRHRRDIKVRFYGFYREKCDLNFLSYIPSVSSLVVNCISGPVENANRLGQLQNLVSLGVGILQLQDFGFLNALPPTLETLFLEETESRAPSLEALSRFGRLRTLYIERHHKSIDTIGMLANLENLVLRSITVPSLSFLASLPKLQTLSLKLGGTTNLEALPSLKSVRELEFWQVRQLDNIDSIVHMPNLETLILQDLPRLVTLPSLAGCRKLKRVCLGHLKALTDLAPIAAAPALEEFTLWNAKHCSADVFKPMVQHPTLKKVSVGLGSFKKNRAVRDLFAGTSIEVGPPQAFGEEEDNN